METPEFRSAAEDLMRLAADTPTVAMCAEAHWSRCHRQLLADWVTASGAEAMHVLGPGRSEVHRLTPYARVHPGRLTYPVRTHS